MGRGSLLSAGLEIAEAVGPRMIVYGALDDALQTMEGLCANEGQQATYEKYIPEAFREQTLVVVRGTDYEWDPIDIGFPMMDYMGEIIEEGNQIMTEACEEATELEEEIEGYEAAIFLLTRGAIGDFGDIIQDIFD